MLDYLVNNRLFINWFGKFEKEELKKFIRLGLIFAIVIGVYWTLRPLKDAIFTSLVNDPLAVAKNPKAGGAYVAWAKIVSLIILFPIVIFYNKALEKFPRQYMFYFLGGIYFLLTLFFGLYFMYSPYGLSNTVGSVWRFAGWFWYVFVESYGSLMVVLFWAFATDTTSPESAKSGFFLVTMLGQLGAILGPTFLTPLGAKYFSSSAPVVMICAVLILLVVVGIWYFLKVTPKDQLVGFHGKNEAEVESHQEPGFLEGLKLMLSQKYLLGIFAVIAIYEILATIIDINFKMAMTAAHSGEAARAAFLGDYAQKVNLVAFLCLLFGISNVQKYVGVKASLALMPIIILGLVCLFLFYNDISVLFWIMVSVKAINYALNGPTMKQLYIPTTPDVKYKSQAWIETFGSRGSKATGSVFNILSNAYANYFFAIISVIAFGLSGIWFLVALYLGNTYQKAVDQKRVVC